MANARERKFKSFPLEIKDIGEEGVIEGYAAATANVDLDKDVIERGAFKKTIQEGVHWPILSSHSIREQIGWNIHAEENAKGLKVRGELDIRNNPIAASKFSLARRAQELGAKMGLSIGFDIPKGKAVMDEKTKIRRIKEVIMWEYSLVVFPANPRASITRVKSETAAELISHTQQLMETIEDLVSQGHRFEEAEAKVLSDFGQLLEALVEPSFDQVSDTLQAAKGLLHTLQTKVA